MLIWLTQQAPISSVEGCPDRGSQNATAVSKRLRYRGGLAAVPWGLALAHGFVCPRCGHRRAYERVAQRRRQCAGGR
jgi:hypothetical protein